MRISPGIPRQRPVKERPADPQPVRAGQADLLQWKTIEVPQDIRKGEGNRETVAGHEDVQTRLEFNGERRVAL